MQIVKRCCNDESLSQQLLRRMGPGLRRDDTVVLAPFELTNQRPHTGNAVEYFTWLSAKLDSIEAMPSSRVSLFFRNAS
ncbi:hypothetical protein ABIE91_006928 [Bradyrhizobium elkanii]